MHPAIASFPSAHFYGGRLRDGVTAAAKPVPLGLAWPNPAVPVALLALEEGREERAAVGKSGGGAASAAATTRGGGGGGDDDGGSYRNLPEAAAALRAAHALLAGGDVASVAVLTPYRGQVRALEHLLRTALAPHFRGLDITVSSVDGYQGREADAVVFSTVRCNARGAIGFLADRRRLNVAITRPRRGLVVVGSPRTLRSSPDWAAFERWARAQGAVGDARSLPPPPWQLDAADGGGDYPADDAAGEVEELEELQSRVAARQ